MNENTDIGEWKNIYRNAGIASMPIPYNKKAKPKKDWTKLDDEQLWHDAKTPTNIAVIAGRNDLIIIDPDDQESVISLSNYFDGLGIQHIGTQSRRGQHWWLRCKLPNNLVRDGTNLASPMVGEVRFRDGYALAAPSIFNGFVYSVIGNPFEIPVVDWNDLLPICRMSEEPQLIYAGIPVPLRIREIPDWVEELRNSLYYAYKGEKIEIRSKTWPSRSEAIFSGMMSLLLRGYNQKEIMALLQLKDKPRTWHEHSIQKAMQVICNTEYRPALAELYHTPIKIPGKTGAVDYSVFLAAISLAWYLNKIKLALPVRELALLSATDKDTVSNSLHRLTELGLLAPITSEAESELEFNANYYSLDNSLIDSLIDNHINNDSNITSYYNYVSYVPKHGFFPELWRREALGKPAFQIYMALDDTPKNIDELQELTGRTRSQLYQALNKLKKWKLAEKQGKNWIRGKADLHYLQNDLKCEEAAKRRRHRIDLQRSAYQRNSQRITNPGISFFGGELQPNELVLSPVGYPQ